MFRILEYQPNFAAEFLLFKTFFMDIRPIIVNMEKLKELRLDVPQVTLLAYELKKSGVTLPDGILTYEELIAALSV